MFKFLECFFSKPADTSAPFKELQGTTVYKIEEKDGKYRLRKTYYKIGPIYNDSPLDSYVLGMLP